MGSQQSLQAPAPVFTPAIGDPWWSGNDPWLNNVAGTSTSPACRPMNTSPVSTATACGMCGSSQVPAVPFGRTGLSGGQAATVPLSNSVGEHLGSFAHAAHAGWPPNQLHPAVHIDPVFGDGSNGGSGQFMTGNFTDRDFRENTKKITFSLLDLDTDAGSFQTWAKLARSYLGHGNRVSRHS